MPRVPLIATSNSGAAKLTGAVNIAVFAVFRGVIRPASSTTAEFKPVCRSAACAMARCGRQKWQETATRWQRMARPAAKTAKMC